MPENYHVFPIDDPPGHNTDSIACLCNPKIEIQDNGNKLIIHNSWDGREYFEPDNNTVRN